MNIKKHLHQVVSSLLYSCQKSSIVFMIERTFEEGVQKERENDRGSKFL